ncbi:hypothetical protein EMIT048CA2_270046 [Pseudomonas chlororaphis]
MALIASKLAAAEERYGFSKVSLLAPSLKGRWDPLVTRQIQGVPLPCRLCYDSRALLRVNLTKVVGLIVDLITRELHTRSHPETLRGTCPCD